MELHVYWRARIGVSFIRWGCAMEKKVKCADCGFFGVRSTSGQLVDVPYEWRVEEGDTRTGKDTPFMLTPICTVNAFPLHEEIQGDRSATSIWTVARRDRVCTRQTELVVGFTPKEHREMIDRKWERKWRVIELIVLGVIAVLVAGGFTILGAFIERGSIP